jgi:signal transduction histidine kinase
MERFFIEAISPFEIAHRSFREANLVLHRVNDVLENQAKRIAYTLHGEASQLVASVHLALADVATRLPPERAKEIQSARGLLDQIEDRIRRISHELRPTILDDLGLLPAIEFLADGISQRWGIPVTVRGTVNGSLPLIVETALYRAAQEGLNNVARHAQASQAEVTLRQSRELIACAVRDDGHGFDPAVVSSTQGRPGLGLVEIRERMAALGGTLRLVPRSERGTEFIVEIPLEASSWA